MFLVVPCKKESLSLIKARQGHSDLICSEINRSFFQATLLVLDRVCILMKKVLLRLE